MFSGVTGVIVFFVGIVLVVLIGQKLKINMGVVAIAFAFIWGMFQNVSPTAIVNKFPISIFFVQMSTTLFFGFVISTGVFKKIVYKILSKAKKGWVAPLIIWAATVIVAMLGAGANAAPVIISPLAYTIAMEVGMEPVLALVACYTGSLWASQFPWVDSGAYIGGIIKSSVDESIVSPISWGYLVAMCFLQLVLLAIYYIHYKGYKLKGNFEVVDNEPFTAEQKKALIFVIAFIVLAAFPNLINSIAPNAVTSWMSKYLSVNTLCMIGSVLFAVTKVGENPATVLKNRVPWSVILLTCGLCTFVNLSTEYNVVTVLSEVISNNVSAYWVPFAVATVGAVLSFVASGAVLWPMLMALVPGLAAATGCDPVAIGIAAITSCGLTGISPISQGGSLNASGFAEETRQAMFGKQFLAAIVQLAVLWIFAAIGGFQFLANILQ